MRLARILLPVTGLVFLVHGLVCFIHPATIGIESGLAMPTPSSVVEVVSAGLGFWAFRQASSGR